MNIKHFVPKPVKQAINNYIRSQIETEVKKRVATELRPKNQPPKKPDYGQNTVINHPILEKSKIIFEGKNNVLYCEEKLILHKSEVRFKGDNAVLYLSKTENHKYHFTVFIGHNSAVIFGKDTRLNMGRNATFIASDHKNMVIGDDCLFSWDPWIFTSDDHPIYDLNIKKRLNYGGSVLIGDHVWIGQGVTILKGSIIGSGTVIGSSSVVTGKRLNSNSSFAGAPVREIRNNVFFTKHSVGHSDVETIEKISTYKSDEFIYSYEKESELPIEQIDKALSRTKTAEAKLDWIKKNLAGSHSKNRFYIGPESSLPQNKK